MSPSTATVDAGATASPFDEADHWDPALRGALLDVRQLPERQRHADRLLVAEGAGHLVHDLPVRADGRAAGVESRPWRLDPIPVVIDTPTFSWLSAAVTERMEALELVLADLYGERGLVRDRVVPAEVLHATTRYRLAAVGARPGHRYLTTYAVDLARTADGTWHVVQDFTDAPPGLGYALLDRSVMARVAADVLGRATVASLARYPATLRSALAATSDRPSPRTVLFSGGIDHASYIDHSYLAVQLGVHLVEGADLVVRQQRLWLRTLDGLEPIDVVYRRLEDPGIDPLEVGASGSAGVPGLLAAARARGVALANAPGSGVLEDPGVASLVPAAVAHLADGLALRLPQLDGRAVPLATTPVHRAATAGSVEPGWAPGAVVVRMFVTHDGEQAAVLPGGTGRVLAAGDDPRLPTACVAKDVWVIGRTLAPVVGTPLPQVDYGRSVPTRAADALYWANRAAERAETMARTVRVVASRIEQDPGLVAYDGGRWTARMQQLLRAVRGAGPDEEGVVGLDPLREELALTGDAVARQIGSLLTEATTVREYLSVTTGRVLERLARTRSSLQDHVTVVDDLDTVLADFAAFAGLWNESTVRGPAWRLGDAGRRIERALSVLDLVEAGFGPGVDPDDPVTALTLEVLLAANESLVAYRRRYRSDVEPEATLSLLVRDATNPRSLAASLERLRTHAVDAAWPDGVRLADEAAGALGGDLVDLGPVVRRLIGDAGRALVARWFAAPVNPYPVVRR